MMIKVINDWYITVEENPINYVVRRGNGEKDKKKGWKDKPRGYFGSLRKAVEEIRKQIGMAVPTKGAEQIFDAILKTFAKVEYDSVEPDSRFVFYPDKNTGSKR